MLLLSWCQALSLFLHARFYKADILNFSETLKDIYLVFGNIFLLIMKQGDNMLGSVCPSVWLLLRSLLVWPLTQIFDWVLTLTMTSMGLIHTSLNWKKNTNPCVCLYSVKWRVYLALAIHLFSTINGIFRAFSPWSFTGELEQPIL